MVVEHAFGMPSANTAVTAPGPSWRGRDLATERVRRGLLECEVAVRLGVTARRVGTIETAWRPSASTVARDLWALDE